MRRARLAVAAGSLLAACAGGEPGLDYVDAGTGCTSSPDDATSEFFVGPPWRAGEHRELAIGSATSSGRAREPAATLAVTVTALAIDGRRSSLAWESTPTVLPDLVRLPGVGGELARLGEDVPVERVVYDVDGGGFAGVRNVDEIRATASATFDLLEDAAALDFHSSIRVRLTLDGLSDELLAELYAEGPRLYHRYDGIRLTAGDPVESAAVLPNPFGGEPLPATATIELTDLVDADGCTAVRETVTIVPGEARRAVAAALTAGGTDADVDEAVESFSVGRALVAQYDPGTGRLWRLSAAQLVEVHAERRYDTTVIEDVTPTTRG